MKRIIPVAILVLLASGTLVTAQAQQGMTQPTGLPQPLRVHSSAEMDWRSNCCERG